MSCSGRRLRISRGCAGVAGAGADAPVPVPVPVPEVANYTFTQTLISTKFEGKLSSSIATMLRIECDRKVRGQAGTRWEIFRSVTRPDYGGYVVKFKEVLQKRFAVVSSLRMRNCRGGVVAGRGRGRLPGICKKGRTAKYPQRRLSQNVQSTHLRVAQLHR